MYTRIQDALRSTESLRERPSSSHLDLGPSDETNTGAYQSARGLVDAVQRGPPLPVLPGAGAPVGAVLARQLQVRCGKAE